MSLIGDKLKAQMNRVIRKNMRVPVKIAALLGADPSALSQDLHRWKTERKIFSIWIDGVELFPAFVINPKNHTPYEVVTEVLRIFHGISDLAITSWFIAINSILDDVAPKDLLATDPDQVIAAARDQMAEITHG